MRRCPTCGLTSAQDVFCPLDGARLVELEAAAPARAVFVPAGGVLSAPAPASAPAPVSRWQAAPVAAAPSPGTPAASVAVAPIAVAPTTSWQPAPAVAPVSPAPPAVAAVAAVAPVAVASPPAANLAAQPSQHTSPVNTTFADSDESEENTREPALQLVGSILDQRYRIDRELGSGGMGVVFKATHVLIDKPVAIKVLRSAHAKQADIAGRFSQEARIASKIKHPNVVEIVDYGATPMGCPYYVMEYLPGHSLAWEIDNVGRLSPARAIDVALQMTRGLAEAHRHGVVHRDLKPDNVFLIPGSDGRPEQVKILDFGIARIAGRKTRYTAAGSLVGTPEYMSPEQATGREVDHRTDLYAVGTLLFEMLTARTPFRAQAIADVLAKQVYEAPPTLAETEPSLPPLVHTERVIRRLLAKSPEERPNSADDLVRLLEQSAAADFGTARVASSREAEAPRPTVMLGSGSVSHEPAGPASAARVGGPRLAAPAAPQGFFAPGSSLPASAGPWTPGAAPAGVPGAAVAVAPGVPVGVPGAGFAAVPVGAAPSTTPVAAPGPSAVPPGASATPGPLAGPGSAVTSGSVAVDGRAPGPSGLPAGPASAGVAGAISPTVGSMASPYRAEGRREARGGGPSVAVVILLGVGAAVFAAFATLGVVSYLQRNAPGAASASPGAADQAGSHGAPLSGDGAAGGLGMKTTTTGGVSSDAAAAPNSSGGPSAASGTAEAGTGTPSTQTQPAADTGQGAGDADTKTTTSTTGGQAASSQSSSNQSSSSKATSKGSSTTGKKSAGGGTTPEPTPTPTPAPEPAPQPKPKPTPNPPDPNGKPVVDYGDLKDPFGDP